MNNYCLLIITCFTMVSRLIATDAPLLREARSTIVTPAIFLLEDFDGASARSSDWIRIATKQYYIEICDLIKKDIAARRTNDIEASQDDHTLSLIESDARQGVIPRWVENIFIISKRSEIMISFFARSGGWLENCNGNLVSFSNPAFICIIDPKTERVLNPKNKLKAVVYANLYQSLAEEGIKTDYTNSSEFVTPLNPSQAIQQKGSQKGGQVPSSNVTMETTGTTKTNKTEKTEDGRQKTDSKP